MKLVRYESAGHVATITMDRASAHNALNNALCDELREAWLRFHESDDRVAVLASSEEKYFSVGADVRDLPVNMWHAVPGLGVELDKPVIAATSGWVVGGAFVLVQMADMCVASETTRFIYPEGKIGTTAGGISSVMARMPHKIAMEFLLVGEEMSAEPRLPDRLREQGRAKGTACRARPGDGGKDRRQCAAGRSCAEKAGPRRHAEGTAGRGRRSAPAARCHQG
jgi:enoyl-CoA hydratase/carnithine racemase